MRLIDVTGSEYQVAECKMLRLDVAIGALRFSLHLDDRRRLDLARALAGGNSARLPIESDAIHLELPEDVTVLTCDTLNVRKGGL